MLTRVKEAAKARVNLGRVTITMNLILPLRKSDTLRVRVKVKTRAGTNGLGRKVGPGD